jgi:hypothetical protein
MNRIYDFENCLKILSNIEYNIIAETIFKECFITWNQSIGEKDWIF